MIKHETAPPPMPNLDVLRGVLAGVQEQVKFADSKAGFITAMQTIIFGFFAAQVDTLAKVSAAERTAAYWLWAAALALYALSAVTAVIVAIYSVMPRLGQDAPGRGLHFWHIAAGYGKDHRRYCRDAGSRTDAEWADDLGCQIVINSEIARTKHNLVRIASRWTIAAMVFWLAAMTATVLVQRSGTDTQAVPAHGGAQPFR